MVFYKSHVKIKSYLNKKTLLLTLIASFLSYFIIYLFYNSKVLGIIITIILIPVFIMNVNKYFKEKLKKKINNQFLELLQALLIGMESGQTFTDSLVSSHNLLQDTLGKQAIIVKEVKLILSKISNNIMLDEALIEFANKMQIENIASFCKVYKLASKNSDDMSSILKKNIKLLSDTHKQNMEIDAILFEKKIEIVLLSLFPIILMMFFRLFYPTYCNLLYGNFIGRVTMTVAIVIFTLAIVIAKNIFRKSYGY